MSRKQRFEVTLRDQLSVILARQVKDPRIEAAGIPSVNKVELNRDNSVARVYVSFVSRNDGDPEVERALVALRAASRFVRATLAKAMTSGRPPELRFYYDATAEVGEQLAAIVAADEAAARSSGRDDE
jgi:ribosome-binding factor A